MTEDEYKKLKERIGQEIQSDSSPVGIDAKKTHIMILAKLEEMHQEIQELKALVKK
jgi:hypothetical protein